MRQGRLCHLLPFILLSISLSPYLVDAKPAAVDPIIARISGQTGRLIPVNTIPDEFRGQNSTAANVTEPADASTVSLPVSSTTTSAPAEETTTPAVTESETTESQDESKLADVETSDKENAAEEEEEKQTLEKRKTIFRPRHEDEGRDDVRSIARRAAPFFGVQRAALVADQKRSTMGKTPHHVRKSHAGGHAHIGKREEKVAPTPAKAAATASVKAAATTAKAAVSSVKAATSSVKAATSSAKAVVTSAKASVAASSVTPSVKADAAVTSSAAAKSTVATTSAAVHSTTSSPVAQVVHSTTSSPPAPVVQSTTSSAVHSTTTAPASVAATTTTTSPTVQLSTIPGAMHNGSPVVITIGATAPSFSAPAAPTNAGTPDSLSWQCNVRYNPSLEGCTGTPITNGKRSEVEVDEYDPDEVAEYTPDEEATPVEEAAPVEEATPVDDATAPVAPADDEPAADAALEKRSVEVRAASKVTCVGAKCTIQCKQGYQLNKAKDGCVEKRQAASQIVIASIGSANGTVAAVAEGAVIVANATSTLPASSTSTSQAAHLSTIPGAMRSGMPVVVTVGADPLPTAAPMSEPAGAGTPDEIPWLCQTQYNPSLVGCTGTPVYNRVKRGVAEAQVGGKSRMRRVKRA